MFRAVFAILLFAALVAGPAVAEEQGPKDGITAQAETAKDPISQFTGHYWQNSQEVNREAYLFGIESVIAVDYFIAEKMAARKAAGKKSYTVISPFEKGWMNAFNNVSRKKIAADITSWYTEHPDQLDRPVLDVIWYELIKPRLSEAR